MTEECRACGSDKARLVAWRRKVAEHEAWGWTNTRGDRNSEREVASFTIRAEHIFDKTLNEARATDVFSPPLVRGVRVAACVRACVRYSSVLCVSAVDLLRCVREGVGVWGVWKYDWRGWRDRGGVG